MKQRVCCNLCGKDETKKIAIVNGFDIVKCKGCGLVYVNPRLEDSGLKDIYSSERYHNRIINKAMERKVLKSKNERLNFIETYTKKKGRLLDVGCSTGLFLKCAEQRRWESYGVEISEDAVEYARSKYGLNVFAGKLEDVPFAQGSFELVLFQDSLEHIPDPSKALDKAYELLKKNGFLVISTPNIGGLEPRITYLLFYKTLKKWRHPHPPYHIYEFSKETIQKLLKKTGFVKEKLILGEISFLYKTGLRLEEMKGEWRLYKGKRILCLSKFFLRCVYLVIVVPLYLFARLTNQGDHMLIIARKG